MSLDYEVETPENIILHYQLAGPSVRMMAYGIDFLIRLGLTGILGLSLFLMAFALPGVSSGLFMIWLFLNGWGYYILSEGFFRGKSLGKHVFGLRVVHELGYPINFRMAVTRNLLRAVDSMPLYVPGLISMFCSKQFQRLGDHASGTIVITERKVNLPREPIILEKIERLDSDEINNFIPDEQTLAVIADFLSRRVAVSYDRGHELSYQLARELARSLKFSGDPELVKKFPMAFLARVYVTFLKSENQNSSTHGTPERGSLADSQKKIGVGRRGNLMSKKTFIITRQPAWEEFSSFLDQFMKMKSKELSAREVQLYSQQFREISNDLSVVRSNNWGEDLEKYLNALVLRGHNLFYQSPSTDWGKLFTFLLYTFPQTFRKHGRYFLLATALFFGPLFISWALVQWQPELASNVLPADQLENMELMYGPDSPLNDEDSNEFNAGRSFMFGFYINNNVGIALKTFAGGILFGSVTAFFLLYNGIMIGTIAGYLVGKGYGDKFLSFVVSHGSFELTAIAVSGGAGFMLGHALLHPGRRTRLEALKYVGKDAVIIGGGAAAMLVVAALIEAFWSPAPIPASLKYTVGAGLWIWVMIYLLFSGRRKMSLPGGTT